MNKTERSILQEVITILSNEGVRSRPVSIRDIRSRVGKKCNVKNIKNVVNHIREEGLLLLGGDNDGYYVCNNAEEVKEYMVVLIQRRDRAQEVLDTFHKHARDRYTGRFSFPKQ